MKKFAKVLSLALAVMLMALTLTACGSSGSSGMTKQFTAGSAYFIGDIGWYNSDVYTLRLIGEDSYELFSRSTASAPRTRAPRACVPSSTPASAPWARAPMAGRPTGT